MHSVKRFFGLLMLGVALWVAQPILPVAAVLALWGMLLLLTGCLLQPFSSAPLHRHVLRHVLQRALGLLVLTLGLAQIVGALTGARDPLRPLARLGAANSQGAAPVFTVIHSESDLAAAIQAAAGRPVVLDFYANWCVSCKEMDRFTFSDAAVAARLGTAVLLKADVTANTARTGPCCAATSCLARPARCSLTHRARRLRRLGYWDFRTPGDFPPP